tara:strand:+ start:3435 stop:4082 length:648 start_codon:yes stop_codon:yes gene_type:complete
MCCSGIEDFMLPRKDGIQSWINTQPNCFVDVKIKDATHHLFNGSRYFRKNNKGSAFKPETRLVSKKIKYVHSFRAFTYGSNTRWNQYGTIGKHDLTLYISIPKYQFSISWPLFAQRAFLKSKSPSNRRMLLKEISFITTPLTTPLSLQGITNNNEQHSKVTAGGSKVRDNEVEASNGRGNTAVRSNKCEYDYFIVKLQCKKTYTNNFEIYNIIIY